MKRMSEADCWRAIPVRLGTFGVMPDPLGVLLPPGGLPGLSRMPPASGTSFLWRDPAPVRLTGAFGPERWGPLKLPVLGAPTNALLLRSETGGPRLRSETG